MTSERKCVGVDYIQYEMTYFVMLVNWQKVMMKQHPVEDTSQ